MICGKATDMKTPQCRIKPPRARLNDEHSDHGLAFSPRHEGSMTSCWNCPCVWSHVQIRKLNYSVAELFMSAVMLPKQHQCPGEALLQNRPSRDTSSGGRTSWWGLQESSGSAVARPSLTTPPGSQSLLQSSVPPHPLRALLVARNTIRTSFAFRQPEQLCPKLQT